MKAILDISCEVFRTGVLVAVGCEYKDILRHAKKVRTKKFIAGVEENEEVITGMIEVGDKGFCMCSENIGYSVILYLKEWQNKWKHIDVLAHEVHHAVYQIAQQKNFADEMEAQAYLFEFLFREISMELNDKLKKYKKPKK